MSAAAFRRFETADELGEAAADLIVDGVAAAAAKRRSYLLGCPGGRTPKPIFAALARRCAEDLVDCSHVVIVMMDDYLENDADPPRVVDDTADHSCRRFAQHDIRGVINESLPPAYRIPAESVWFPEPTAPERFDRRVAEAGGVDLFVVASGASDGHVAFCGPGTALDAGSSIVELAPTTRADNAITFPSLTAVDAVPTHGVSVGLGTVRRLARSVLLVIHGSDKSESLRRVSGTDHFEPDWPATFIHQCANAEVWYDASAQNIKRSAS